MSSTSAPDKTPEELSKDLSDAQKVSEGLEKDVTKKAIAKVIKQPTKDDLALEVIALKKDRDMATQLLDSKNADIKFLQEELERMKDELEKADKARVEDRLEAEQEYTSLHKEINDRRDDRIDAIAQDMAELKAIVKAMAPPQGLRATTQNPYGTRSDAGESVSSAASCQSVSAYVATGESTTVSGIVVTIYERLSNGRLYTWRDKTGEYKPISQAQYAKRFKNTTLVGEDDNDFNQTNVSNVPIDLIKGAKLDASVRLSASGSK